MKIIKMTQVSLVFENYLQVAWLPSKFAVQDKTLSLKSDDGWRIGKVSNVHSTKDFSSEELAKMEQSGKAWKSVTDY